MRKYIFIFIFISFFTNCSTISTLLESGYDDPVKLLNSAIDDVAVAIQPSIDENFDKEVAAFFEQNERFTDPESPDYDPYFTIRYVIDSDNHSITRLSNDSVIKLIKEMNISHETDEIMKDMIEYSIVSKLDDKSYGEYISALKEDIIKVNDIKKAKWYIYHYFHLHL